MPLSSHPIRLPRKPDWVDCRPSAIRQSHGWRHNRAQTDPLLAASFPVRTYSGPTDNIGLTSEAGGIFASTGQSYIQAKGAADLGSSR